jgi:hypothetical protein
MKREKLIICVISCLFFLLAGCQQQAKKAEESAKTESKKAGPKIEFESKLYDFGKVGPLKKLKGEFKFTNTGDSPLKITRVEKCCGAVTKLDKDELSPGESGVLQVQYTSSRMANKMMKHLYINSNDKDKPRITLTIKAETVLKVEWKPKIIRLLLDKENAGCPKITLTSTENKPFSITSFQATNDTMTADFDDSAEEMQFVLEPKVDMEKLQKKTFGRINVGLAYPQPDTPPETISITFRTLPRFSVIPSLLMFYYDNSEQPIKKYLSITNNYNEEFEVESMSSKEGRIKVFDQKKIRNRYQIALEITPPTGKVRKKFTDTFTINLKDGQRFEVPCKGTYKPHKQTRIAKEPTPDVSVGKMTTAVAAARPNGPAPKITFENVVHDFGEVSNGKTSTTEFKFTNTGEGRLKIAEVKRCCGVVTKLDKTEYAPGESGAVKVSYRARQNAGTFNRKIHVVSNDRQNPDISLTVKAKVVPKIDYEPRKLEILIKGENAGCPEITLKSLDNQAFAVKSFTSSHNCIIAEVDPSIEATEFVLKPSVDFEKLQGSSVGLIRIGLTHPECKTVTISYRVVTNFNVTPRSLIVVNPAANKPVEKKLFIQSNYNEDFEIDSVSSENGLVKLLSQQRTDKGYQLDLEIMPPRNEDKAKFTDTLYVNIKDGEKLAIKCYGLYTSRRASR